LETPLPEIPFRTSSQYQLSIPVRYDIHQARLTCIVPRTRITQVQPIIDITSRDGIIVNGFQPLLHHLDVNVATIVNDNGH
jgi:hypothetical protein